jgi:hypothetical protein
MSLTIFLAICILGCDVLIYFLYEWAFGTSERIRKRQARSSRMWVDRIQVRQNRILRQADRPVHNAPVIEMKRTTDKVPAAPSRVNTERLAYRRLVASFATPKPRS